MKVKLRRIVILAILLISVISAILIGANLLKPKPKYNLILISVDTLRADHMGVYGYPKNTTPNIDKWAKNATVFTNAYTIFPLTFQSFYTLFTGTDEVLKNDSLGYSSSVTEITQASSPTLPQILQKAGFKTAAFVTNPVLDPLATNTFKNGFNTFNRYDVTGLSEGINRENSGELFLKIFNYDYDNSKKITSDAISWLAKNKDYRFFAWLHYTNPHQPYIPPQDVACRFNKSLCDKEYFQELSTSGIPRCTEGEKILEGEDLTAKMALYDAEIASLDEYIGKVFKQISDLGLDKNSIIVFYGDHGESFEHGIMSHGYSLYNTDVKIPLIVRYPEVTPGKKSQLIDNTDILPTLLSVLGVRFDRNKLTGEDFANVLTSGVKKGKKEVFFMTPRDFTNKYGVTNGESKYIFSKGVYCVPREGKEELYNIGEDKQEIKSIFKSSNTPLKDSLFKYFDLKGDERDEEIDKLKSIGY